MLYTFNSPSVPNALSEVYDGRKRISVLGKDSNDLLVCIRYLTQHNWMNVWVFDEKKLMSISGYRHIIVANVEVGVNT